MRNRGLRKGLTIGMVFLMITVVFAGMPMNMGVDEEEPAKSRSESRDDLKDPEIETASFIANTRATYGFELEHETDLDRGIKFNDTLQFNVMIKNIGNADDELYFKFANVPPIWNVTLAERWNPDSDMEYWEENDTNIQPLNKNDVYKNVTINVVSPTSNNASFHDYVEILFGAWSKNNPELEYSQVITVTIRDPDVSIRGDLKILNADLKDGPEVTIQAKIENKDRYAENVEFSLYVNDVLMCENITKDILMEDSEVTIEFHWNTSKYYLSTEHGNNFKFKVFANINMMFSESDFSNNVITIIEYIGGKPDDKPGDKPDDKQNNKEYNLWLILAMAALPIVIIIIYAVYRWHKKI